MLAINASIIDPASPTTASRSSIVPAGGHNASARPRI